MPTYAPLYVPQPPYSFNSPSIVLYSPPQPRRGSPQNPRGPLIIPTAPRQLPGPHGAPPAAQILSAPQPSGVPPSPTPPFPPTPLSLAPHRGATASQQSPRGRRGSRFPACPAGPGWAGPARSQSGEAARLRRRRCHRNGAAFRRRRHGGGRRGAAAAVLHGAGGGGGRAVPAQRSRPRLRPGPAAAGAPRYGGGRRAEGSRCGGSESDPLPQVTSPSPPCWAPSAPTSATALTPRAVT